MKTIAELAREAGLRDCTCDGTKGCLERFTEIVRADERVRMAEQPAQQEPVAWRFTGIAGLKRYMTQTQYDAQTPETKKWYEPFLCANCTPSPQPAQRTWVSLTDEERSKIWGELPSTRNEERDACIFAECVEIYLKERNT